MHRHSLLRAAAAALVWEAARASTPAPTHAPVALTLEESMMTTGIDQYPGSYYLDRIKADDAPDFYLGWIPCPGPTVCVPSWIGDGVCNDCFGCDQYMVATGFFGDCSTCDYFWSGGAIGVGEFDGGDCADFVFPASVNNNLMEECLISTNLRTASDLAGVGYTQMRNTIILELHQGGWGSIPELQANTDVQLASKCEYANIKECLRTNSWYDSAMDSWSEGDLRFEAADRTENFSTYQSIELVYMTDADLLGQCVLAGVHQKILGFGWLTAEQLATMTGDDKRNHVIGRLSDLGKGTVDQLQTLHDTQLRYLLNHVNAS